MGITLNQIYVPGCYPGCEYIAKEVFGTSIALNQKYLPDIFGPIV